MSRTPSRPTHTTGSSSGSTSRFSASVGAATAPARFSPAPVAAPVVFSGLSAISSSNTHANGNGNIGSLAAWGLSTSPQQRGGIPRLGEQRGVRNSPSKSTSASSLAAGSEWSFFGVDIPITGLSLLAAATATDVASSPTQSVHPRSSSALGSTEVWARSFGGDRWRLEILRNPATPEHMSVFLTCQLLDSFRSRDPIPTTLFLGIREPGEQVGRRDEREGWVWQRWEREYTFAGGCEFWECTTFPSFDTLFGNDRIRAIDALVLSIQIQTPVQANAPAPQLEHYHYVPRDLLRGLEALFDDPLTSDVVILCCERSVDEDGTTPMFRKRSLHTHSSILRSRSSSFFGGMLNDGAPWREGDEDKERKRSIVRIRDFDYVTLHALVHWLYTNEVTFTPIEDARSIPSDDLPETWLSESPDSGWGWFAQDGAACEAPSAPTAQAPSSPSAKKKNSKGKRSAVASMAVRRSSTPERDTSAASAAGRLSPLGAVSPTTLRSVSAPVPETAKVDKDPHHHPSHSIEPASALAIYKLAHRMELQNLADLALCHIVQTLTPRTAFPLLLSTFLWGDLYSAIKEYALAHYQEIVAEDEFSRCYREVGDGIWEQGGAVLLDFTMALAPLPPSWP